MELGPCTEGWDFLLEGSPNAPSHSSYSHRTHMLKFSGRKQRFLSKPAQSWTPTMPKMKKTKKQRRRTFPSMGSVSRSSVTRMRIPEGRTKRSPKKENLH